MIDFSMYLKNDIDDYRSEERYDPIVLFFYNLFNTLRPTKSKVALCFMPFPWQQEQPDSIHLGSEELRRGAEPATKVRHLHFIGNSPICRVVPNMCLECCILGT